ncbi:YHYH domain-containing protein [Candidatus Falkowbacteria bacterium]|nr:YHYH domain-containing protein [Candidatus Falkowbacteria bacterium]
MKKYLLLLPSLIILSGCTNAIEDTAKTTENYYDRLGSAVDQAKEISRINDERVKRENADGELSAPIVDKQGNESPYYKVVKVVDGDTVDVLIDGQTKRLRLIGINTPETVDPRKPVECFGKEASANAKKLLSGQEVSLEADDSQDSQDKYGRLLRYVRTKDGLFYNLEAIKQGYAYEYTYDIPYKYQKEFKAAQAEAQAAKVGLWADGACSQRNVTK